MKISKTLKVILLFISLAFALAIFNHSRQKRLNVILITLDALRYDHLSCYGYKRNTSANIDMIARKGVMFTQAIAQSSHTAPSVSSIMTSAMPNSHFVSGWGRTLNPRLHTLAEILKEKGFENAFFCGNLSFKINAIRGIRKGFDTFFVTGFEEKTLTGKAVQFINQNINKQFFIYLHYMNTHSPYISNEKFSHLFFDDDSYDKTKVLPIVKPTDDLYGYRGIPETLSREYGGIANPDYYIAKYDQGLRTVDEEIGIILKTLKTCGLEKRTILIVTSDHGEMLGENDLYFHHAVFLYEPLIRVPLIISCDKIIPQGKIISDQISASIDIMPTILDVLGINTTNVLQGNSLFPLIHGKKSRYPSYVLSDEGTVEKCVRTKDWKLNYVSRDGIRGYHLYNLKNDPGELNSLPLKDEGEFKLLKDKLDGYIQAKPKKGYAGPLLTEDEKNSLRSLGYIQ